jgi:TIR domain
VLKFAERLQGESGETILDTWYLKPGQDKTHFMEQAIATSDFVIVICTDKYAKRADNREGGVGCESTVITGQMAEDILTNKFLPVLRSGTYKTATPIYLKSRMDVNLTDDPIREDEYDSLLRVLHGEPIEPPPLGSKPDFSKKAEPKAKIFLQAAGEALAEQNAGTLLGPLKKRPQAEFHAQYDKPGTPGPWVYALIRQWQITERLNTVWRPVRATSSLAPRTTL